MRSEELVAPVGSTWNSSIALMIVRWGGICQLEAPRTSMSPGEACKEGTGDDLGGMGLRWGGWSCVREQRRDTRG